MPRILVIDDDALICEMIASNLQMEGFETIEALDGRQGVEAALRSMPDLIICDVMMPDLDGFATLREIRKNPATATIPFIFLTGQTTKSDMRQGMELGADDFLAKPIMISELLAAIRTRLQKQQLARQETERKLNELRMNLSLSLPHEIRTPLSGIVGFAEVLRDDAGMLKPSDISEMAGLILKSANRLGHLVENFLTYAQLEIISSNPNRGTLIGNDVTRQIDTHIEALARKKGTEHGRLADVRLSLVTADAAVPTPGLKRIVEELLDNALKFSKPGSPVEVTTEKTPELLVLSVTDHGVGMDVNQIAEIGAYRQFDRQTREQQGSGLGLAITRKMTELYGGKFDVVSFVGKGTTVTLHLPLARAL